MTISCRCSGQPEGCPYGTAGNQRDSPNLNKRHHNPAITALRRAGGRADVDCPGNAHYVNRSILLGGGGRCPRKGAGFARAAPDGPWAARGQATFPSPMGIQCGIVGLPNVGKSTIFNAITNAGAQAANY